MLDYIVFCVLTLAGKLGLPLTWVCGSCPLTTHWDTPEDTAGRLVHSSMCCNNLQVWQKKFCQRNYPHILYTVSSLLFSCVRSALRNWQFQVSKDGTSWVTLRTHKDDTSLNEPGSTATWSLSPPEDEKQGWRHIKIQQTGRNASGQTHYLSVSGLEIYGSVNGVCDDLGKKIILFQQWILKMFRNWEDSENSLWISCR